jgi:hypothetical protein
MTSCQIGEMENHILALSIGDVGLLVPGGIIHPVVNAEVYSIQH